MKSTVSVDIVRPENMKQEARLKQKTITRKPPPEPTVKIVKPRKPRTVAAKDLDPHEMKIADARTGYLKRDPFDEIPSPLDDEADEQDEADDRNQKQRPPTLEEDEPETANQNQKQAAAADEIKEAPADDTPNELQRTRNIEQRSAERAAEDRNPPTTTDKDSQQRRREDDDDCEEILDMNHYLNASLEGKARDEVMIELVDAGYKCLYPPAKAKKTQQINKRDIP
ncbi:hypothetical protein R1sor_009085 [Riccia sorocarpa]|uniref:Uncharacterized protein n=1 Tax=Riccia sorocarpa TaxID=122646 RepID=A0ABD3H6N7_9MARC